MLKWLNMLPSALSYVCLSFSPRSNASKPMVYNALTLGCTWEDLIKYNRRASWSFPYPTFGIRGMTSIGPLHWILVLLLEWLPSVLCDIVLGLCGRKQRYERKIYREISRVTNLSYSFVNVAVSEQSCGKFNTASYFDHCHKFCYKNVKNVKIFLLVFFLIAVLQFIVILCK